LRDETYALFDGPFGFINHTLSPRAHLKLPSRQTNVELSNLTKVLFPGDHIVKAQLIEYYLKIAPTILRM